MVNLLVEQPQRGSNTKWSLSKTIFWILSLSISVRVLLPLEMWLVQNGRFSHTPLHFAAKKGNWKDMNLFFINLWQPKMVNVYFWIYCLWILGNNSYAPLHLAAKDGNWQYCLWTRTRNGPQRLLNEREFIFLKTRKIA